MIKNRLTIVLTALCLFSLPVITSAQKSYWVPVIPPKAVYNMVIEIDTVNCDIKGSSKVKFINPGRKNLELIAVKFSEERNSSLQAFQNNKKMRLVNDAAQKIDNIYLYELIKPAKPGEKVELEFKFDSGKFFTTKNYDAVTFQSGAYPRIWWDGLKTPDDYNVKIKYPSNFTIAVTGRLDKKSGSYIGKNISQFAVFLGREHQILSKEVQGVLISVLYPKGGIKVAQTAFDIAVEAIPFYKKMYGIFPFSYFNIIPGGSEPWGGYNFAPGMAVIHGMTKYDKRTPLFWQWITAHEIGHHYWGESVYDGNDPSFLWIELGIYTDREFIKSKKMDENIHQGFIENNYYNSGVLKHLNTTLDITPEQDDKIDWDYNNIVVHGKGFAVMSALESVIGRDAVIKTLQKCYKEYLWKTLSFAQFESVCEEVSGQNLKWFFEEWIRSSKYLYLTVKSITSDQKSGGGFSSRVVFKNQGKMLMPVKVLAYFADGSTQKAEINRALINPVLTFESKAKLDSIQFDPEHQLPPVNKYIPQSINEIKEAIQHLPYQGVGDDIWDVYKSAKEINLNDRDSWFYLGLKFYDYGDFNKTIECYDKVILYTGSPKNNTDSTSLMTAYCWKGLLADERAKRGEAVEFYKKALDYSTNESMTHTQFGLVINRENIKKYLLEPYKGFRNK